MKFYGDWQNKVTKGKGRGEKDNNSTFLANTNTFTILKICPLELHFLFSN